MTGQCSFCGKVGRWCAGGLARGTYGAAICKFCCRRLLRTVFAEEPDPAPVEPVQLASYRAGFVQNQPPDGAE